MNNLVIVAEGILDAAAAEYRDDNLASVEAVKQYAFGGLDIVLSTDEAQQVMDACKAWVDGTESGDLNGSNDYYYTVEKPLLGEEATL